MLSVAFLAIDLPVFPKNAYFFAEISLPFRPVTSLLSSLSSFVQPDASELTQTFMTVAAVLTTDSSVFPYLLIADLISW